MNFDEAEAVLSQVIGNYDSIERGGLPSGAHKSKGGASTVVCDDIAEFRASPKGLYTPSVFTFDQYCINKLFPAF